MTWRRALIYFVVLAAIGGYFYTFEVVQKQKQETAEREAKRLYAVKREEIQSIEISPRDQKPVLLERKEQWRIVQPAALEVETASLDSLLAALSDLSSEARVGDAVQDLKPYGLDTPGLKIRFHAGNHWHDLAIGDKNPVTRGYYTQVGPGAVYLINESNWSVLNKGLNELRRRALFSFQPDDVRALELAWDGGAPVRVRRTDEAGGAWQSPDEPLLKIKPSKVDNVLQQVQFLRAQSFLDDQAEAETLARHGLQPPHVSIRIELEGERTVALSLGRQPSEGKQNRVTAMSSDLGGVVEVESNILKDIPKDLAGLEDRSLVSARSRDVKQVSWRFGESSGSLSNIESNKWRLTIGDGEVREPKESWRVNSFLWELQQTEFVKKLDPAPARPENPYARLDIDAGDRKTILFWEQSAKEPSQPMRVWVEEAGRTDCVEVGSDPLKKVEEEIRTLLGSAQQKS